jgi:hypothetical protein
MSAAGGTLGETLIEVWRRTLVDGAREVDIGGRAHPVGQTRAQSLKTVSFVYQEFPIEGIEQNPQTKSNWAKLAQEGKRIMQFRVRGRYIGNVCEGTLLRYPAWKGLGLPE